MKLKKKSICTLIMAGVLALLVSGCSDTRIGYIDAERVMKESPQIQQIVTTAEAAYNEKNKEVMDVYSWLREKNVIKTDMTYGQFVAEGYVQ